MDVSAGLDLTQSFLVLAEELNFRRTADRLAIDQSALSRRIQRLERLLGFALFERTTREVSLTPAGRTFYDANAGLVLGFAASVSAARRVAEGKTGVLRLAYMAFAALDLMPEAVARFRAEAPDVDVGLTYMRTQGQKLALAEGEIDLGYMIGPFEHGEFNSLAVASDPLCVVMPAGHALAARRRIETAELANVPLVLGDMAEWEAYRWRLDEMFGACAIRPPLAMEASSTMALLGLVKAGLGVTIYPARIAALVGPALAVRPIADARFAIATILVWRRNNRSESTRRFVAIARSLSRATANPG